ncbi:hypothetical protein SAMN05421788_10544 [Filimonas lacunae]|uniref:Phosphate-selective porin O and P n=1 Tax=Filimonas lacunae TaxID=477680 RepID=A0A173MDC6_9BACT|nr:hypothetical protein [Filimonas lacunae]BAV05506.1 hypothetical protein FLA_1513 [Filimonas lacunae]SIT20674.1 hypothetical protein SAMN05421788_10544 [Filimonas lacunae]
MQKITGCFITACLAFSVSTQAQYRTQAQQLVMTNEDSLNAGLNKNKTVVSGYGSAYYQRNNNLSVARASLERAVLFVGHQFNRKISFFSELEFENAKVTAGESGAGEIAMEQAFLKFNLNPKQYIVAGLFVPRIGILNENHLPVNFNGVERTQVETYVIPATWREVGVGFYGSANRMPINYSVALVNGLNSAGLEHSTGLMGARAEGSYALANNLALTASLQYNPGNFKFQVSGYMGGTVGLSQRAADSLNVGLKGGTFGTPVYLTEGNMQWSNHGLSFKALAVYVSYPDAHKIYQAYGKDIASAMYGAYAEVGYDWLYRRHKQDQFITFVRTERLDLNSTLPNGQKDRYDGTLQQTHVIAGFSYLPVPNVVVKADVRFVHTGKQNEALIVNPPPNALPYQQNNQLINLGIGYSF